MTDPLAYLKKREEDRSRGIAWAQLCLEGAAQNMNIAHDGGRAAEDLLRKHGWRIIDTVIRAKTYAGFGAKGYGNRFTKNTYRSSDSRFEAAFSYSRFSTPMCWCGFKKRNPL